MEAIEKAGIMRGGAGLERPAAATCQAGAPAAAWEALNALPDKALATYQPYWAVKARPYALSTVAKKRASPTPALPA